LEHILKVEGGKMLRIRGEVTEGRVSSITITGDFFLHPEEVIDSLESSLIGVLFDREAILAVVTNELAGATLVGAAGEDVADLVMMLSD